ncbi:MAG: hypothetical protein KIT27_00120 [Legionellales bacterium]|nr:hypothetical protein [Legionellales bacterium]
MKRTILCVSLGMSLGLAGCSSLQDLWGTRGSPADVVPAYAVPAESQATQVSPPNQTQAPSSSAHDHLVLPQNQKPYTGQAPASESSYPTHSVSVNEQQQMEKLRQQRLHNPPPSSFGSYDNNPNDVSSFEQNVLSRKKKNIKQLDAFHVSSNEQSVVDNKNKLQKPTQPETKIDDNKKPKQEKPETPSAKIGESPKTTEI